MATLFIAGAGCSLGTLGNSDLCPPIATDFVSDLKKKTCWSSEYPEIAKVLNHLETSAQKVGLEELWTCIDLHAKFPGAFPIDWIPRGQVVCELKRLLVRMYGCSCDKLAESILPSSECTMTAVACKIDLGDTLVSFNYDTVIERVIRKLSGKQLWHGKDLKPGTIRFAKPHGSVSWNLKDLNYQVTDGQPLWDSLSENDLLGGKDPLLLGAVPLKSELISEVQEYYHASRVFEVIREQWRTVANAVASCDRVVVLGYRFPKEDIYGRFFFQEGLRMRIRDRSKKPIAIDFYALDPDLAAIRSVFPNADQICFKGPVTSAKLEADC